MRPQTSSVWGERGISRFPREVLTYVPGVCDRAGLWRSSRYRCVRRGLPHSPTASASRSECLTRLNTRPAHSPINASTPPSRAAPHDSGPMWFGRVRWWRGSGLRMMPTFPPPPLSFRTVRFPQYGWKVGLSGSAFPHVTQVKPAPGMPCVSGRFASALRALRYHTLRPALCQNSGLGGALPFEKISPLPQRSSLRSGFYCPGPSSLIRPHPPHSQAHSDFTAWRFIRNAFAVLVRLGDPRLVPCFRCSFLIDMPPSTTPGSPSAAFAQFFANGTSLRRNISDSAFPFTPSSASDGKSFRGFTDSLSATACRFARLPGGSDWAFPQPTETFTPELSTGRSPFPLSSITTVATKQAPPAGLAPTGTSTSIAALCCSFSKTLLILSKHKANMWMIEI
jgi:hypothetical protein